MNQALFEFSFLDLKNGAILSTELHAIAIQLIMHEPSIPVNAADNILIFQHIILISFIWRDVFDSMNFL